ncbi:hypothetical protein J6590_046358 [Homalodisca vitripennis]|nr:hypothetical protein J6590_046358 [Homalodisca vitripennis]
MERGNTVVERDNEYGKKEVNFYEGKDYKNDVERKTRGKEVRNRKEDESDGSSKKGSTQDIAVTGAIPIDLLIEERMKIWEEKEAGGKEEESKVTRRE